MTDLTLRHGDFTGVDATAMAALTRLTRGVESAAYPNVPEPVHQVLHLRDQLQSLHGRLGAELQNTAPLPSRLIEDINAGTDPLEALLAVLDHDSLRERAGTAAHIIELALTNWSRLAPRTIQDSLPVLLGGLRERLEAVVDGLRSAYATAGDLDVDNPDPLVVAKSSPQEQAALVTIATATEEYQLIRQAQRDALVASALPIPGSNRNIVGWTWKDVFVTGIHEVKAPDRNGLPGVGLPTRAAIRAVVTRNDLWLPDPDDLAKAFQRMESAWGGEIRTAAIADAQRAAEREAQSQAPFPAPTDQELHNIRILDAFSKNS